MNAVKQMSAHHQESATALLRKLFKSRDCGANSVGINREDRKRVVLPFNDSVQSGSRSFRDVKKNQRLAVHRATRSIRYRIKQFYRKKSPNHRRSTADGASQLSSRVLQNAATTCNDRNPSCENRVSPHSVSRERDKSRPSQPQNDRSISRVPCETLTPGFDKRRNETYPFTHMRNFL